MWKEKGSFLLLLLLLLDLRQETECLEGREWGVGKIGIEGNRERIQIKTIVHLDGKDG